MKKTLNQGKAGEKMILSTNQIKGIIKEEIQNERRSNIVEAESRRIETLHEEIEKERIIKEISLTDVGHFALDIGGLIPGWGEEADLANAALYATRGEFLMAALSVISMIPVVGDVIGKGGKLAMSLGKGGKVASMLKSQMPKIKKLLGGLADNPKVGQYADDMIGAVDDFVVKTLNNPQSKEAIQGLQKLASTKPVTPVKGGKLAQVKSIARKVQQRQAARQNVERTAQTIQGAESPEVA